MAFNSVSGSKAGKKSKRRKDKTLSATRVKFENILSANLPNIDKWLKEVAKNDPSKALDLLFKMSSFVIPKVRSIEVEHLQAKQCSCEDLSNLSDEELEEQLYKVDRVLYPDTYKQRRIERLNLTPIEFIKSKEQ